jgi:hypothetical protein
MVFSLCGSTYGGGKETKEANKEVRLVFLDVDGVLNNSNSRIDKLNVIEKDLVKNLKYIVKETQAEIVVSSTWRYSAQGYPILEKTLKKEGMRIMDRTPFKNPKAEIPK